MQNNNFKKKSLIQWFSEAKFYHSKKNPSKTIEILLKRIFIHLEKINDNKFIIKSFILCLVCYYEIGKFKEIVDFYETFVFPYKNNFEIVCIVSKTLHNLKDYEKEIQVLQNYMDDDYESELRQAFCSFKNYLLARAYRKIGELNLALEKIILSLENGVIIKLNMLSKETFNVLKNIISPGRVGIEQIKIITAMEELKKIEIGEILHFNSKKRKLDFDQDQNKKQKF